MAKKRVFLSFIEEDKERVQGLRLLAANPNYDLEFYDESLRVPINSRDADYVKQRLREKIGRTTVTVCLISENTHRSAWVDWELEESDKKGNTIIAMALKGVERAVLPKLIKEKRLTFHSWDPQRLNELIGKA
ncbi:MAG: TIR domain-containing protein [Anaerolineae bacterium]